MYSLRKIPTKDPLFIQAGRTQFCKEPKNITHILATLRDT